MRACRRLHVRLPKRRRAKLDGILNGGIQPVRVVLRALTLSQLHQGKAASEVADNLRITPKTVREMGRRYEDAGLAQALYDKQRPRALPLLNHNKRLRIVAMVCAAPPQGYARWTVRLITGEAVKRNLVPKVGREAIRILLQCHDLQPGTKKCGVWPSSTTITSSPWKMCWRSMKGRYQPKNRWCASPRGYPRRGRYAQPVRRGRPAGIEGIHERRNLQDQPPIGPIVAYPAEMATNPTRP